MNRGESKASMERRLTAAQATANALSKVNDDLHEKLQEARASDAFHVKGCGELEDHINALDDAVSQYITAEAQLQLLLADDLDPGDTFEFEGETYVLEDE